MKKEEKIKKENKFFNYLKKLNKREKYLLFISVLIFTFIIFEEVLIMPISKKNDGYVSEVKKLTSEKRKVSNTIINKENLQKELNRVNIEYNKKLVSFPKTEKQAEIIKDYIDYSDASGVTLTTVNFSDGKSLENKENTDDDLLLENTKVQSEPKKENSEEKIITNSVNLTLNCSYENLLKFINYLQEDKRLMNIINVQINKNTEGMKNVNSINAVINLEYYNLSYFKNEKYDFNKGTYGKKDYFN